MPTRSAAPSRWGVWGGVFAGIASVLLTPLMSGLMYFAGSVILVPFGFVFAGVSAAAWMLVGLITTGLVIAAIMAPGPAFSRWMAGLAIVLALGGSAGGCWAGFEAGKVASDNVGKLPQSP